MLMSIISLALAYVFLLLLLFLVLLESKLATSLKFALVVFVSGFYIWHYNALQAYRGWPAEQQLPEKFEMLGRVIVEPNLKRDEEGGIFLWVRDLEQVQIQPRAYRLPYSRDVHRKVDDTLKRQQQGQRFVGRPVSNAGSGPRSMVEFEAVEREREALKPGAAE